jgi:hypothetical protein
MVDVAASYQSWVNDFRHILDRTTVFCLSSCLSVGLSVCLYVLPVCLPQYCLSACHSALSACLPVCLSHHLSVLSFIPIPSPVCFSDYIPVCLSVCLFFYPFVQSVSCQFVLVSYLYILPPVCHSCPAFLFRFSCLFHVFWLFTLKGVSTI